MGTLFDSWSWNRRLPAPFDDPAISMQSHVNLSKYNLEKTKTATLHGATLSAILQMVELYTMPFTDDMGAIGTQGENLYIAEYPSKTGELHTVVFNRNSGRFYAGRYDDVSQPPKPYILKESEQSGSALIFALLNIAMEDSEFMEHFDELCNHKASGYPDLAQAAVHQVYEKLLEVIASDAKAKNGDKQQFAYVESPLIQAMRKGYVLELQEPTVISNPGVLVGLNSLLDTCGAITLPTGERVERHPDTVVVVTTNVDYEGCRSLNQSILSRMDIIVDMEEPDVNTLVKRVSGITGCKEKDAVKMMAGIVSSIQKKCRMEMIDDGCCGMRELISWVQSYMICGDMMEAAEYTILSSVSADAENRKAIRTTCLEPLLKS